MGDLKPKREQGRARRGVELSKDTATDALILYHYSFGGFFSFPCGLCSCLQSKVNLTFFPTMWLRMAATAPSNSHPHHLHLYFVTRLRFCGVGGGQESDRNADRHVIVLSKRSGLFKRTRKEIVLLRARGLAWKPTQRREHGPVMCSKVACAVLLQMQHSVQ